MKKAGNKTQGNEILRLKSYFQDAQHGSYCRTRSYRFKAESDSSECWLEAHKMHASGWLVQEKRKHPAGLFSDKPFVEQILKHEKTSFFDAVQKLAEYEETQERLGYALLAQPDFDELGCDYFIPFAEREGIVFDIDGKPFPTQEGGHIVGRGKFPEEAYRKAKEAWDKKDIKQTGFSDEESLLPVLFKGQVAARKVNSPSFKVDKNFFKRMNKVLTAMEKTRGAFSNAAECEFRSIKSVGDLVVCYGIFGVLTAGLMPLVLYNIAPEDRPKQAFQKQFNKLCRAVTVLPDSDFRTEACKFTKEINLGYHILWARQACHDVAEGKRKAAHMKERLAAVETLLLERGMEDKIDSISQRIKGDLSENTLKNEIIGRFRRKIETFKNVANDMRHQEIQSLEF